MHTGCETNIFWHSPELGSLLYSLYKIPLARPNFHSYWRALVSQPGSDAIPLWLCVLHVHWCRDCETVPEQHWTKAGSVSQSQCTPPQHKQISFGIKTKGKVQGQCTPKLMGSLTVLKCICGLNWEILTNLNRWGVILWTRSKWGQFSQGPMS